MRTRKVPIIDANIPIDATNSGNSTRSIWVTELPIVAAPTAASATVAIIDPTYDSKRSAPIPATSPTLSPTLSATVAGFLGSSSGIPCSTLPTRSAPTSAALVYIPPPTLANNAIEEAPNPKPATILASLLKATNMRVTPSNAIPTTETPMTAPLLKATRRAGFKPCMA